MAKYAPKTRPAIHRVALVFQSKEHLPLAAGLGWRPLSFQDAILRLHHLKDTLRFGKHPLQQFDVRRRKSRVRIWLNLRLAAGESNPRLCAGRRPLGKAAF